jgi:fatty-acyl-CoA synthase
MDPATAQLPSAPPSPTMAVALRDRAADSAARVFLRFEETSWTYAQTFDEACRFANLFLRLRATDKPFHVAVLMDNVPSFVFAELGCALAGATLVGLNPTRTGAFLARDLVYADCQIVVAEARYAEQLHAALQTDASACVRRQRECSTVTVA